MLAPSTKQVKSLAKFVEKILGIVRQTVITSVYSIHKAKQSGRFATGWHPDQLSQDIGSLWLAKKGTVEYCINAYLAIESGGQK